MCNCNNVSTVTSVDCCAMIGVLVAFVVVVCVVVIALCQVWSYYRLKKIEETLDRM